MEEMVFGRRYRVVEKIGTGGMADVYKAVDEVLGRTVAVKVLHPQYAADPTFVARFRQEAQAAANLSNPNIVNIYDWGRDDSTYYIVMEYVNGIDLKTLLGERGALDSVRAAEYGIQVCGALATAHGYDIIHRDIKPHNIVLTPDGTLKVMDFGIARAGNTTMTQTGSVLGTAQYISPEQAQGRPLTPASDLYSLGVVLYELTVGKLPFEGDTAVAVALKQVNEEPRPPRQVNPKVSPAMEAVILRAMRKNPRERYASAGEMRDDLRRVVAGEPVAAAPVMAATSVLPAVGREEHEAAYVPPTVAPRRRWTPLWWVLFAVALVALGLLGAWMTGLFGRTVAVPDLRGKTQVEAASLLQQRKLRLGDVTAQTDSTVPRGQVVDQSPPPGTPLDEGSAVSIVVSGGVTKVTIPDVSGMSETDAVTRLEQAGLTVLAPSIRENSDTVPVDNVIRTEPKIGTVLDKGAQVRLIVSRGQQTVTVPNLVGMSLKKARRQLSDLGLKSTVSEQFDPTAPAGEVIQQNQGQGSIVVAGSTIGLVVSKGPAPVVVPDVIGDTLDSAQSALQAQGFKVTVTRQDVTDPSQVDVVIDQTPNGDTTAKRGDTVTIVVGQEPTSGTQGLQAPQSHGSTGQR